MESEAVPVQERRLRVVVVDAGSDIDGGLEARTRVGDIATDNGCDVSFWAADDLCEGGPTPAAAIAVSSAADPRGTNLLQILRRRWPRLPILYLSDRPSVAEATRVMQAGASWYGSGRAEPEVVMALRSALAAEWAHDCAGAGGPPRIGRAQGLVGDSPVMRRVLREATSVASSCTTVLLSGEPGTGKECLARAIHEASPRRHKPFIALDCAALAEAVLESDLDGHDPGAFTGATQRREGRLVMAHQGTLFLDEIGAMTASMQVELLSVLHERRFERMGGKDPAAVDVRIIAATNRNLRQRVEAGTFRADLFYRLHVMNIEIPPLRQRLDDIPLLVEQLQPRLEGALGLPHSPVAPKAIEALRRYDWPGNVRELESVLQRALVMAQGMPITDFDLPRPGRGSVFSEPTSPGGGFREIERHAIMTTYEACGRSLVRTAEILGISPRTVQYRLREYRGRVGRRLDRPSTRLGA